MKDIKTAKQRRLKVSRSAPRHIRVGVWMRGHIKGVRLISFSFAILYGVGVFIATVSLFVQSGSYTLSSKAHALIGDPNNFLSNSLKLDQKKSSYEYNQGYKVGGEAGGRSGEPRFSASFSLQPEKGTTVTDPVTDTAITFKPKFALDQPRQDKNRLVYPLKTKNAVKVISLATVGFKEDIVLNKFQGDELRFAYDLELPQGTEARMESDGSLAIYGADYNLLGDVSVGDESDQKLLDAARAKAIKRNLLFTFPAPFIKEFNKKVSDKKAWFTLKGTELTITASGLKDASYPLTIDPSIYIETAAKLMKGNNETNIDFDVDQELIQKSQTTGARIDGWTDTTDMNSSVWDQATAAAGGYVYRAGGRGSGRIMPRIVGQQKSTQSTNSTSFVMNLPTTRPSGDLYVALISHDGTGAITGPAGGGWTEYADTREHAAYYKVGANVSGGNEAASYTWTGGSEEWAGVIVRIKNFDSSDIVSGTVATGSNGVAAIPIYPTVTPDTQGALILRASGFDDDVPPASGWAPTNHSEIAAGNSGGTGDSGYTVDILDSPPLSGAATGTATLSASSGINSTYGASTIAINGVSATSSLQASVEWAKFNTNTGTIDSPNPGDGTCSGWCTNSAYNLPEARIGMTMVSYNGFLYALGGSDGTNRESTVWIAKIGANGEPSLWHPTGGTPTYWYASTNTLSNERSYTSAVAYNNRLYLLGGQTNAAAGGVTTVEYADLKPTGDVGSWSTTGMQALPDVRHGHSVHVYNDVMYLIGGDSNGTLRNTVYYSKLNSDGTMNPWTLTSNFSTPRSSRGGVMTGVWGGYIYIAGGCTTIASNICTAIAGDVQLASINADGTLAEWGTILNLRNERIGSSFVAWQNGLYRFGGCSRQDPSTGECYATHIGVQYGIVNQDGDASTVATSVASGTSPCSGTNPTNCDLPGTANLGNMLSATAVMNGYLYVIGGCTNTACSSISANVGYVSIGSDGALTKPASCPGGTFQGGMWCVDTTRTISGGVVAAGTAIFNGRIYLVGGQGTAGLKGNVYNVAINNDGSLASAWTAQAFTGASGIAATSVSYTFAYARANPSAAATYPGNLYIFGGCSASSGGIGCTSGSNTQNVYKCWIRADGNIETTNISTTFDCTTTGQLQIGTIAGASGTGLALHAGTVYANYIYLIGGVAPGLTDLPSVRYAKFDDSNNVVGVTGFIASCNQTPTGTEWVESCNDMSVGRRRGTSFGYNGYLYAVGGYDASQGGVLSDIQFTKIDVSDGSLGEFTESGVTINQRWGLSVPVSNSYAFVIGGCTVGASPTCTTATDSIQTFQIYNNDSGTVKSVTGLSDDTFAASTDRWGASSAVLNGYLYVAGGCTSATDCTAATGDVQYAPISATDGSVGTWASATRGIGDPGTGVSQQRAWGKLVAVGGYLYYLGGQDGTATNEQSAIYYAQPSSGNITASWGTASGAIGDTASLAAQPRTKFGAAVWNSRIYVVGGLDGSAAATNTVFISPRLTTGGDIAANSWIQDTDVPDVARYGAAMTAYANNLYMFGGNNGTNYLNDAQFTQINSDGSVDPWTFTTSLPGNISQGEAFAANGYMYVVGGRSATSSCAPNTLIAPISANTLVDPDDLDNSNLPTGIGEWYETNVRYAGGRYGATVSYDAGKVYITGGGCTSPQNGSYSTGTIAQSGTTVTGTGTTWTDNHVGATITYADASTATIISVNSATSLTVSVSKTVGAGGTYTISAARHTYSVLKSQPQVAKYSRMIDTDTDVFPNSWLMNGIDNSVGAHWKARYRSMHDLDTLSNPNEDCGTSATMPQMTTWGQETNFGDVTLGNVEVYTPLNSSGGNINCARYYYFSVSIDASQTFGYPEDVERGPTIADISLFFTSDPARRLRHGKTFTGGELQPLDTPCRKGAAVSGDPNYNCPLP